MHSNTSYTANLKTFLMKYRFWIFLSTLILIFLLPRIKAWLQPEKTRIFWEIGDHQALYEQCLKETEDLFVFYPEETRRYCHCSAKAIQNEFAKSEYLQIKDLPIEEQKWILSPYLEDCLAELKKLRRKE